MSSPEPFYNRAMPPRIAFCTTVKNRAQHLKLTLQQNIWDNLDYPDCVFVVLDYNSKDDLTDFMRQDYLTYRDNRVAYYKTNDPEVFHMAHAKNMAHRCGMLEGADILVNLDADGYTGPGFAQWIADQYAKSEERMFLQAMQNRWVTYGGQAHWLSMNPEGWYERPVPKGCNGRIVVSRNAFLKAGGYDEKYDTWGPDDKDFNLRLRRLGYTPQIIPRQHLNTVSHPNKMRFREYPHVSATHGNCFQIAVHDSNEAIANFGNFGCGTVYRNFAPEPIVLAALPTRIFGIGMHKTATTSLHMALSELGFDSAHWSNAHWAKSIWREMNQTGQSPTLEKSYALCDLPIPLLMRKLDKAYPNSKFILTMLDDQVWLKAARLHWDIRSNPNRARWDTDPFSHLIHEKIYGRREFDATTFLLRYRHHNRDVLNYFKDRPNDLLVMNMNAGAGWKELCGFLDKPVPTTPYPHGNPDAAGRHWLHAGDM